MAGRRRRLARAALGVAVLPLIVLAAASAVLRWELWSWRTGPDAEEFAGRPMPVHRTVELPDARRVATVETGRSDGPLIVLVHGTPGDWRANLPLMIRPDLADRALLVSMDRLGWAGSAEGGVEPSLARQGDAVAAVIRAHPGRRPVIVYGHSWGGAVAARAAIDHPESVDGLVVAEGSIDPALHGPGWARWGTSPWVAWAIPQEFVDSSRELVVARRELGALVADWSRIRCPVELLYGEQDGDEPPRNIDVVLPLLPADQVRVDRIPDAGHDLPWRRPEVVAAALGTMLDTLDPAASAPHPAPAPGG